MASKLVKKIRSKAKLDYSNPVLVINKSNKNVTVQLLLDNGSKTAFTLTTNKIKGITKTEKSVQIGTLAAEKLKELKIEKVLFNRNGNIYHGRVKAIAESVRNSGIVI